MRLCCCSCGWLRKQIGKVKQFIVSRDVIFNFNSNFQTLACTNLQYKQHLANNGIFLFKKWYLTIYIQYTISFIKKNNNNNNFVAGFHTIVYKNCLTKYVFPFSRRNKDSHCLCQGCLPHNTLQPCHHQKRPSSHVSRCVQYTDHDQQRFQGDL